MFKFRFINLLICCFVSTIALSQDNFDRFKTKEEVKAFCLDLGSKFTPEGIIAAFEMLDRSWFISELELMHLKNESIKQIALIEERFGKPLNAMIAKEVEAPSLLYRVYVVKRYENHGIRLVFTFYLGKDDKWVLNSFKWDDTLSGFLNE